MQPAARGGMAPAQYRRLLAALARLIDQGRRDAEAAAGRHVVLTYHAVGSKLVTQKDAGRAGYGEAVIGRLADDLGIAASTLHRAMAFARAYPDGPPDTSLRWGHYRELLVLPDAEQRRWYAEQAAAKGWSAQKLREAVREQRYRNRTAEDEVALGQRPVQLRRPTDTPYVYKATVVRVVDGDTLVAMIDLGFQVHRSQRLRLAGIDTPNRDVPNGVRAMQWVEQELATVEFVVLKTDKIDLYGRYVAHVFYAPGESDKHRIFTEGQYLNQRLVDERLAQIL